MGRRVAIQVVGDLAFADVLQMRSGSVVFDANIVVFEKRRVAVPIEMVVDGVVNHRQLRSAAFGFATGARRLAHVRFAARHFGAHRWTALVSQILSGCVWLVNCGHHAVAVGGRLHC